jgi:hypothetical protein
VRKRDTAAVGLNYVNMLFLYKQKDCRKERGKTDMRNLVSFWPVFIGFIDEDGDGSGLQVNLKGPFCFLGMTFLDKKCGCRNSCEVSVGSCITNPFVFLSYPALLLSYKDPMCLLHSRNREVVQYFCHFAPSFQECYD